MIRRTCLAVLALLAPVILAYAEDPVSIDVKDRGEGETVLVEQTETMTISSKMVDQDGKTIQEHEGKLVFTYVYRETCLNREDDKAPTRLRREYEKAQVAGKGDTADLPLHGKTVVIEKKDGKYHFSLEGRGEMPEEVTGSLDGEFNSHKFEERYRLERDVLPAKPVSLDAPWTVDVKSILAAGQWTGRTYDEDCASGTGVLQKFTQRMEESSGRSMST